MGMTVIKQFDNVREAIEYRSIMGCGGWIFAPFDPVGGAFLFEPGFTPKRIIEHPICQHLSGNLIGTNPYSLIDVDKKETRK